MDSKKTLFVAAVLCAAIGSSLAVDSCAGVIILCAALFWVVLNVCALISRVLNMEDSLRMQPAVGSICAAFLELFTLSTVQQLCPILIHALWHV
jgi:hypothetical protein